MASLRENEQRLFLKSPEHNLLQIAQSAPPRAPPPPPPLDDGPIPDPFNRNPQYQLRTLQANVLEVRLFTTSGQSQIDATSYVPTLPPPQEQGSVIVGPPSDPSKQQYPKQQQYPQFLLQHKMLRQQYDKVI